MVSIDWLKEICKQPEEGKAYYRPFICKGELSKVDIFLVGTNHSIVTAVFTHKFVPVFIGTGATACRTKMALPLGGPLCFIGTHQICGVVVVNSRLSSLQMNFIISRPDFAAGGKPPPG